MPFMVAQNRGISVGKSVLNKGGIIMATIKIKQVKSRIKCPKSTETDT